jgi:BlaI family transcriptional regulator, penicillinase repressor
MARPSSENPTELELAILKVLWRHGPGTVESAREALAEAGRDLTHSSVITVMNIMVRKKYLKRTKKGRAFEFEPLIEDRAVNQRLLNDLVNRVFDGSAKAVLLALLETSDVGPSELAEVRAMIVRAAQERPS